MTTTWNFPFSFAVDDQLERAELRFTLSQPRVGFPWCGYQYDEEGIGEANVPVKRLLEAASSRYHSSISPGFVEYPLRDESGAPVGELEFSFIVSDGDGTQPQAEQQHEAGGFSVGVRWLLAAAAAMLMAREVVVEILMKVGDLAIEAVSLVLAVSLFVGLLMSLPDLLRRMLAASTERIGVWNRRLRFSSYF